MAVQDATGDAGAVRVDVVGEAGGRIAANIERVIDGKPEAVRLAIVVLLAEGHLLIEDVPGRRQDEAGQGAGPLDRLLGPPDPVHPRPAAVAT